MSSEKKPITSSSCTVPFGGEAPSRALKDTEDASRVKSKL